MPDMTTIERSKGRWKGILLHFGLDGKFLTGRHSPCPLCDGTDRYRWDDKDGSGSYLCNQCGAGYGMDLLMKFKGWDFRTAAHEVDQVVGKAVQIASKPPFDEAKRVDLLNKLWRGARPIEVDDMAHKYLAGRVSLPPAMPSILRFTEAAPVPYSKETCPSLLAAVHGPDNKVVNIHRTFLGPNGKADMKNPRAMMPGALPDGSAIRLFPRVSTTLGVGEGMETCFAAATRFSVPVWSTINSTMLEKWKPPSWVKHVMIFGDADHKFGGQAAAYKLAHRLTAHLKLTAEVHIPNQLGTDWADAA